MSILNFYFQDQNTPIFEAIVDLHNDIMFYLIMILLVVLTMLINIIISFCLKLHKINSEREYNERPRVLQNRRLVHGTLLEIVWTIIPSVILFLIAGPSFALLYSMDEIMDPAITIKAIGHQWYWTYEYADHFVQGTVIVSSSMRPENELSIGELRLLEVDHKMIIPARTLIRVIVTADDVLHSWAIPSLGVKMDAVPGRLNSLSLFVKRQGIFYGQCSELCGVQHGFMPICIKAVDTSEFLAWLHAQDKTIKT